jgi:hypothetical protein
VLRGSSPSDMLSGVMTRAPSRLLYLLAEPA